ncbi:HNH endonuclease [Shewanella gelidimarina]|uniref:WYL domain-containing protein n=1 Tax=Shewanella gelidimarina TaxID=56813 RepID=UPI00200DAE98|nr:WYL domain-containing protein [Shewanella gelidimarina]MCL1056832.1 HNH endonuclease [Shewanella gelidimarina]
MSSEIIKCPFCSQKNRVPLDGIVQRAKCGSCGQFITGVGKSTCRFCKKCISDGVNLSDGSMVHELCLSSIQERKRQTEIEITALKAKLQLLYEKLQKVHGFFFKISSIFFDPKVDVEAINESISLAECTLEDLTKTSDEQQDRIDEVYELFLSYPPDWDDRKRKVALRDGKACSKCGDTRHLHLHHISPLGRGGTNELSNLKLLCEDCHHEEHHCKKFSGASSPSETAYSKRVANIRHAIKHDKHIKFSYKKPNEKSHMPRLIKPIELVSITHQDGQGFTLCIRGYCELRKEERHFALKRMKGLKVT